jgi:hypothetical protein
MIKKDPIVEETSSGLPTAIAKPEKSPMPYEYPFYDELL